MAIQRDIIRFTGRIGAMVGRKGPKGQYVASVHQPIVSQPNSDKQVSTRSAFTVSSKVAAYLGILGQQVLLANGHAATDRGELVAELMALVKGMTPPSVGAVLPADLPLVRVPRIAPNITTELTGNQPEAQQSGSVVLTMTDEEGVYGDLVRRLACIILYNETLDQWRSVAAVLPKTQMRLNLYVPSDFYGEIHAYGYFLPVALGSVESLTSSFSMGSMLGNDAGYSVEGAQDVVVGNFDYGQIIPTYKHISWQIGG